MKGRYVVRIGPGDIGRRVTIRSRLAAAAGKQPATDTVGLLRSWEDGVLTVERRDGSIRTILEQDLLAARVVPAPPPRRR